MAVPQPERRLILERRLLPERRRGLERRIAERRMVLAPVLTERRRRLECRKLQERRTWAERRTSAERRAAAETVGEHIRNALQLLVNVGRAEALPEEDRRDLEAAVRRLRVALDDVQRPARRSKPDPRVVKGS